MGTSRPRSPRSAVLRFEQLLIQLAAKRPYVESPEQTVHAVFRKNENFEWTTLADVEGNEFCVVQANQADATPAPAQEAMVAQIGGRS